MPTAQNETLQANDLIPAQGFSGVPRHSFTHSISGVPFWIHWVVGIGGALGLLALFTIDKTGGFDSAYRVLAILAALLSIPVYSVCAVYHTHHGHLQGLSRLSLAWFALFATLLMLAFITKTTEVFSREVIALWAFFGLVLQGITYVPLQRWSWQRHRQIQGRIRSAIIGTGPLAQDLANRLKLTQHEKVQGLIGLDELTTTQAPGAYPLLGPLTHIQQIIADGALQRLYIALPLEQSDTVKALYLQLLDASVDVVWVPDLNGLLLLNHSVTNVGGLPAIKLNESPLTTYPNAARIKAALDRSLALLGVVILAPLLVVVAALVKLTSPGPILFRQLRHGWNGQIIEVWKFRSMCVHDDAHVKQATRNDCRITPLGRFIRRTSIDELPQLFNVLQGTMSLVGPRPHALAHNNQYAQKIDAYMIRHRIKPGITGLAQVSGYRGETETLDKMEKRVELDLAYINNWSLWLDIKILIKTPFSLFDNNVY